jgi:hypothetical protein
MRTSRTIHFTTVPRWTRSLNYERKSVCDWKKDATLSKWVSSHFDYFTTLTKDYFMITTELMMAAWPGLFGIRGLDFGFNFGINGHVLPYVYSGVYGYIIWEVFHWWSCISINHVRTLTNERPRPLSNFPSCSCWSTWPVVNEARSTLVFNIMIPPCTCIYMIQLHLLFLFCLTRGNYLP